MSCSFFLYRSFVTVRLSHIKLAGFKSFVDPTTIPVPGQMVAVVGPNGCGKSNVIDAVRWVLGESSAKQLRGESMQDVIFNGAGTRKPASRASVELVFDNQEGRASGPWGQYAEIAIKRVLTRQGESSYWINNQQVRRRDIADLFLGTGVGTKGYAVIEQGMISRIIEARPEELRAYLEEAAGVSKYKERRKETESRLNDTRDNLLRLDDIRQELESQVEKLGAQAEVAAQYQQLRQELTLQQNLHALARKAEAQKQEAETRAELARLETEETELSTRSTTLEAQLEAAREAHFAASDALSGHQSELADTQAQLVRLEEQIRHRLENRTRLEREITQARQEQATLQTQLSNVEGERELASMAFEEARFAVEEAALEDLDESVLLSAEADFRREDDAQQALLQQQAEQRRSRDLAAQNSQHAHKQLAHIAQRRQRLEQDAANAQSVGGEALAQAQIEREQADTAWESLSAQRQDLEQAQSEGEALLRERTQHLSRQREQLAGWEAEAQARASMLAQAPEGAFEAWLSANGLADSRALWQCITVDSGWERAVEVALADYANARLSAHWPEQVPPARLTIARTSSPHPSTQALSSTALLHRIRCQEPRFEAVLHEALAGIDTRADLSQCLADQAQLGAQMRLICPDGHLVGATSVRYYAPDSGEQRLENAAHIQRLQQHIEPLRDEVARLQAEVAQLQAQQAAYKQQLAPLRQALAQAETLRQKAVLAVARLEGGQAQQQALLQRIENERLQLKREEEESNQLLSESAWTSEEAALILEEIETQLEQVRIRRLDAETALNLARSRQREMDRQRQALQFTLLNAEQRVRDLTQRQQEWQSRSEALTQRLEALLMDRETLEEEDLDLTLQEVLDVFAEKEQRLAEARDALNGAQETLRHLESARQSAEQGLAPLRERYNQLLLKHQEAKLAIERFDEELQAAQADEVELLAILPENKKPAAYVADIARLSQAIQALGAVNLAALEELAAAQERHHYLAHQADDLNEAMATLMEAITRIDADTRDMLQSTFDAVNASMAELSPMLFGGGRAELVLTGEEILASGVQIIAQPPGKKNSTIHLLSGGEKALTAMSLVFSLFRLNPAPFCLLDEVDAPLDDANTGRFCALVKQMSARTQFLYISHNRITMEAATQLIGVTMQEQGVSRIVAVDILEALQMREQG